MSLNLVLDESEREFDLSLRAIEALFDHEVVEQVRVIKVVVNKHGVQTQVKVVLDSDALHQEAQVAVQCLKNKEDYPTNLVSAQIDSCDQYLSMRVMISRSHC